MTNKRQKQTKKTKPLTKHKQKDRHINETCIITQKRINKYFQTPKDTKQSAYNTDPLSS